MSLLFTDLITTIEQQGLSLNTLDAFSLSNLKELILDPAGPLADDRMAVVAAASYYHTNGFFKVTLARNGPSRRALRLHVWPADVSEGPNMHDHRWNFVSKILSGDLQEARYSLTPGTDWNLFSYSRDASPDDNRLQHIGQTGLRPTGTFVHVAGETYFMPLGQFHLAKSGATGAVTIVVTDAPLVGTFSRVVSRTRTLPTDLAPSSLTIEQLNAVKESLNEALR